MRFEYNRDKETLLNVMDNKSKKKNIVVKESSDRIEVTLAQGKFDSSVESVPVTFKGKITEEDNTCVIEGRFSFGFYLYTMVIVAAALIVARFLWSAYKMQTANMILCGIVAAILVIVMAVVVAKAAKPKEIIEEFLNTI
ncbi:MAG: hypothetical protein HFG29_01525 [Eubacterium sp.]|nr:hypothetical protein [Eubacterium sp.]